MIAENMDLGGIGQTVHQGGDIEFTGKQILLEDGEFVRIAEPDGDGGIHVFLSCRQDGAGLGRGRLIAAVPVGKGRAAIQAVPCS